MSIQQIIEDFEVIDDWEERYRYIIELGRRMPELAAELRTESVKVRGCASQVWLISRASLPTSAQSTITFQGDSDALIVRGLVALIIQLYSGKTATEILAIDARSVLKKLGLDTNLSQQRANGLFSMVERIRTEARALVPKLN